MKKSYYAYDFIANFDKINKKHIYLLVGNEYFYIDSIIKKLKRKFDINEEDFDFVIMYAGETSAKELIFELRQIPMMSERHFVILKDYERFSPKDKELIAEYSEHPFKESVLILVSTNLDGRQKSSKKLIASSLQVICKKPYSSNEIFKWLSVQARLNELYFTDKAKNYFSTNIALSYQAAFNEFIKVNLYIGNAKKVTLTDVKEALGISKKNTIFELYNAIGRKDIKNSLKITENLLYNEESPIMIISMLTTYFKTIWLIRTLLNKGYKIDHIKRHYLKRIYFKFQDDYIFAARKYDLKSIRNIFAILLDNDTKLKSIDVNSGVLMDLMVMKILERENDKF